MTDYKPLSGRGHQRPVTNQAKLSVRDVYAIRRLYREEDVDTRGSRGRFARHIGWQFQVSPSTVMDIVNRHSWMRLPPEPVYWRKPDPSAFWSWWLTIWIFLSLCETKPRLTMEATVQAG